MITRIHLKPEILLQIILGFMSVPKQVKPKTPKTWLPSHSSLQSCATSFYKFVTYYMFNNNYNINTWNIRKQVTGYSMTLKRKKRMQLKEKGCAKGHYHLIFNNVLKTSSKPLQSNSHKGCCVLNTTDYNYKLRSVIGREDDFKITKWTLFDKQVRDTFFCSWIISQKLVDHTNIGRAIDRIFDKIMHHLCQ